MTSVAAACGSRTGLQGDLAAPEGAALDAGTCNSVPAGCRAYVMPQCRNDEQGIVCGGRGAFSYNYSITCRYMGANPGGFEFFCCPGCGM
jgi:hypothetical protein